MALNPENHGPADDDHDPQLAQLYREAGREVPPPRLDAAIRAAARRSAGFRPRPVSSLLRTWRLPVAIAAVVVLSVSMVTLMVEKGGERLTEAPRSSPSVAPPGKSPPEVSRNTAPLSPPEPTASSRSPSKPPEGGKGRAAGVPKAEQYGTAVPPPAPAPADRPKERKERVTGGRAEEPVAKQALPSRAQSFAKEDKKDVSGTTGTRAPSAETGGRPTASPRVARLVQEYENQPPEKWLEKILELRQQGDSADAAEMLSEFKNRFPAYPLPPPLR